MEQKTEALESGTKRFEELEFCQLEEESRMEEKRETQSSRLLQEQAEFHHRLAQRKVRSQFVAGNEMCGIVNLWIEYLKHQVMQILFPAPP